MSKPSVSEPSVGEPQADSAAFQRALLRSERHRILGVTAFLMIFAVAIAIRIVVLGSAMSPWGVLVLALFVAYELTILRLVRGALQAGRDLPAWLWTFNILLEMMLPALGTAFLASPRLQTEYRALATPWVLAFFPFIILSILRLSPWICRTAGIAAALGYLAAAHHHGWQPSLEKLSQHSVTQTAVPFYALILLASGYVAGMVGGEIRKHVQAALREAETQRQLKQVEHDLETARSIQQSLLPRVRPTIKGFQISGWNRPADATGGDYFDWKHLPDGRLVVTLADVTGHGIGPALLASVCRAYARSSFSTQETLVKAVQHLNQSFGEDLTPGRFATFVAAVCIPDEDQVELLSAGQGPLFVYSLASDSFQKFAAQAIPLGLMPELNSGAPVTLSLKPGDLVVLATDGFFEWENSSGEDFGISRLTEAIRKARDLPPEEIIAELYSSVLTFSNGSKQQDDLTAVVIKRVAA